MTAEIAVFNRSGIALAADSAVTTTIGFSEKIYNNADKLFELSKYHPIGLMIYSNASICNAPWELLIKSYRKVIDKTALPYVKDYAQSFFDFIKKETKIITPDMQKKFFFSLFSDIILPRILKKVQDEDVVSFLQKHNTFPSTTQYHQFITDRARNDIQLVSVNAYYADFDDSDFTLAIQEVNLVISSICALRIEPDPSNPRTPYPKDLTDSLVELFANYICKESSLDTYSGIVFAGYGEQEYYPFIESHLIYGIFNQKLMRASTKINNNSGQSMGIYPFAQDEEVHTFMQGCSKGLATCFETSLDISMNNIKAEITNIISSQYTNINRQDIENAFDAVISNQKGYINNSTQNYITINHVQKVLSILGSLAKIDLGYMAESLVNLTAFKRKVSNDSDTVGGPIDVAVLSKGEGFVWLKRKHYFDKELNYQYFNRQ